MERASFKFTADRHQLPLVIWNNPPGLFAEFTPDQLRKLAADLYQAATVAESKRSNQR